MAYVENNLYKRSDNRTFNNTNNIPKTMNQHTTDVAHGYKKQGFTSKKAYYMFDGVVIKKHDTIYTNCNINVTEIKTCSF